MIWKQQILKLSKKTALVLNILPEERKTEEYESTHFLFSLLDCFLGYHFMTLNKVPTDIELWGREDI